MNIPAALPRRVEQAGELRPLLTQRNRVIRHEGGPEEKVFQKVVGDVAPAIYVIIIAFVISRLAELLISGSGKWASLIQKVLKRPMSIISGLVVRIVLPDLFTIPVFLCVHTVDSYFIKVMGKLD